MSLETNLVLAVILIGLIILIVTGLGILTVAIFGIKQGQTPLIIPGEQNAETVKFVTDLLPIVIPKPSDPLQYTKIIASIPTRTSTSINVNTNEQIIGLDGTNLLFSKISLISFWVIITIGLLYISYNILFGF
jgi:hypothetical protein